MLPWVQHLSIHSVDIRKGRLQHLLEVCVARNQLEGRHQFHSKIAGNLNKVGHIIHVACGQDVLAGVPWIA